MVAVDGVTEEAPGLGMVKVVAVETPKEALVVDSEKGREVALVVEGMAVSEVVLGVGLVKVEVILVVEPGKEVVGGEELEVAAEALMAK